MMEIESYCPTPDSQEVEEKSKVLRAHIVHPTYTKGMNCLKEPGKATNNHPDQYTDIEYNKFSDDLDTTTGLGFVAGLNNITVIFNDSYFRDFIFKNQGVYNTMYTKIVNRWNEVFTNFAEKCFPKSDQVVQYTHYKTRWENILKNKYYELITDGNVQIIEQAYTSNPYIKEQVIKEIGSIVSVIVLEAFINMLPITFQNDTDIQMLFSCYLY